jgi:hypothetical protein
VTTVEILRKAKRIQKRRGLWKGEYQRDEKGPCCILGALSAAVSPRIPQEKFSRLVRIIEQANDIDSLPGFNDRTRTTLKHVLDAFDRAIALASQPQGPGDGNG